ncbi:unnamed protein product [Brassica rapa]|uniref:Uncharacterized protein n=1 Tax=Brassica campestris TaxID=3711 RepID=A0A8D9DSK4_BRACM|nr:unnamed protein product [Brassica rapa]
MIHGPCGHFNPKSPCMENNVCTKKYPRPNNDNTSIDKSGYVLYRRRRNKDPGTVKSGAAFWTTMLNGSRVCRRVLERPAHTSFVICLSHS